MNEKTTGYVLLFAGVAIMFYAAIEIYLVFTNQIKPFPIFTTSSSAFNISDLVKQLSPESSLPSNAPGVLQQSGKQPTASLLSGDVLNQSLNMASEFFLMSFFVGFGGKIAGLGISLLRPIVVKVKAKEVVSDTTPDLPQKG